MTPPDEKRETPSAAEIDSEYLDALNYSCKCGVDEMQCRHCGQWEYARSKLKRLERALATERAETARLKERLEEVKTQKREWYERFQDAAMQASKAFEARDIAEQQLQQEREAHAETKGFAEAWHGAVDTAATIMELPHALPTPGEFLCDIQDRDRELRQERSARERAAANFETAIQQYVADNRALLEARERAEAQAKTNENTALINLAAYKTEKERSARERLTAAINEAWNAAYPLPDRVPQADASQLTKWVKALYDDLHCTRVNFRVTNAAYVKADSARERAERELAIARANHIDANERNMKAEERATQAEQDLAALRALIVQYRDEPALYRKLIAAALKGETGNG
jgi:chromosome segregation ATPase